MMNTKTKNTHTPKIFSNLWNKLKNWIEKTFRSSDPDEIIFSNAQATGAHKGTLTKYTDAPLSARRLVSFGKNSDSVKSCGITDIPFGCTLQESDAAGEPTTVILLGISNQTVRLQAAQNITSGNLLVCAEEGKIKPFTKTPGSYWVIGLSLTNAQSGELVEVATTVPYQVEVK